ncbi:hypothetical protein MCRO_0600 [Mycoplasma crocodyli MP145]|uniref:Uncharacterized protein n=1 Tax=Mycoplasma crocodyli (strain ATCC 51981 / MP145) TaxID=512564 RepID=D5E624_MYCCM|nr:hypothetical protein MCRO_0600 [Mycoplasma crocodyli MP145]
MIINKNIFLMKNSFFAVCKTFLYVLISYIPSWCFDFNEN